LFLQEFVKQISKDLPSEQIKKIASGLTTLSNEKMKEEKAAEKGGKKTKAAKTKTVLNASRDVGVRADTAAYDEDFGECVFLFENPGHRANECVVMTSCEAILQTWFRIFPAVDICTERKVHFHSGQPAPAASTAMLV
jgi:hypothetical protein